MVKPFSVADRGWNLAAYFVLIFGISTSLMMSSQSRTISVIAGSFLLLVFLGLGLSGLEKTQQSIDNPKLKQRTLIGLALYWAMVPNILSLARCYVDGGFDVAIFSQALFNIKKVNVPLVSISFAINHYGEHLHAILHPMAWIYHAFFKAIPAYLWLILTQAFFGVLCLGLVAWLPSRQEKAVFVSHSFFLHWLCLCFFAFWGITSSQKFEFHPVVIGAFLHLAAVIFWGRGYLSPALILLALTNLCGEMFLISSFTWMGGLVAFQYSQRFGVRFLLQVTFGFLVGLGFLYYYLSSVAPQLFGQADTYYQVGQRFQDLGTSFGDLLKAPFLHPEKFFRVAFSFDKLEYFFRFIPLLLAPVLVALIARKNSSDSMFLDSYRTPHLIFCFAIIGILSVSAAFGKVLLSSGSTFLNLETHYVADMMPGLIGIFISLAAFVEIYVKPRFSLRLRFLVAVPVIVLSLDLVGPGLRGYYIWDRWVRRDEIFPQLLRQTLRSIPSDRTVFGNTFQVFPELASREKILSPYLSNEWFQSNPSPDYLVLGWPPGHNQESANPSDFSGSFRSVDTQILETVFANRMDRYELVGEFPAQLPGHIWLWKKM